MNQDEKDDAIRLINANMRSSYVKITRVMVTAANEPIMHMADMVAGLYDKLDLLLVPTETGKKK